MIRALANKLQERAYGGPSPSMQRRLNTLAREFEKGTSSFDPGVVLKTGARLVRQWRGNAHTVLVLEDGFEYEGQRYCSLSMIAERITGARWSGPRFFGLTKRTSRSMSRPAAKPMRRSGPIRCAVYTRKSSEEGLEQEFNSLQAQREACEAFIKSQRHEGWACLPDVYDDGGLSGATMERPALQQLLAEIQAGLVDIVVVYKVDRLTRSLADFAKIVEILDAKGASFVSVTQQFKTTTSMGRLTLNVLLSFAQFERFEREVTGERIRDKIAASKEKGMWMGGVPPLGYEARDRGLVIVDSEAETVRYIFRRYAELGSIRLLKEELEARVSRAGAGRAPPVASGVVSHSRAAPST